ncbi:SDR family NAD(P)-dependent oxidoreductase [Endozoicomonas arenosclerae]|uniref:SDR family NAD(P)-dependent oxidoreductase n=1 Tax=Endozoicomonas arenosclerae TaxID=1633495 RepID=UPI0007843C8E|nr:SDR family NAD(P)-dependent oxidoreductase [Endozoicomonas arenosclerae]
MIISTSQVAVITGAGGGLGRSLAIQLARKGCHLALVDINHPALEETQEKLAGNDIKVTLHQVDVGDIDDMHQLYAEVMEFHGRVNLLINNAGITLQKSFASHSLKDWQRVININLWGPLYGCRLFLDVLRKESQSHIVNLSSMAAFIGLPSQSSYCVTKSGVQALSECLYAELKKDGVGVTSVHPGAIKTDMIQATLADSDDLQKAQKNYELAQKVGLSADRAAQIILQAVEKNKARVRVGKDSWILDILRRLMPAALQKGMARMARTM